MSWSKNKWFHSRSSSHSGEFKTIFKFYQISKEMPTGTSITNINDNVTQSKSTIGTKVRAFIRFGFLKNSLNCPLEFTTLGKLWYYFYNKSDYSIANNLKEVILINNLALYFFDENGYSHKPNIRPLYELIKEFKDRDIISLDSLEDFIGSFNLNYWITDLKNAKVLELIDDHRFRISKKYEKFLKSILDRELPDFNKTDWIRIHNNLLDPKNPFLDLLIKYINKIMYKYIGSNVTTFDNVYYNILEETEDEVINEIDINNFRTDDSYTKIKTRKKQTIWSKIVKENFNYKCCLPKCDINIPELLTSAHIKPYRAEEIGVGHRANPSNGLCLCPLCHQLFDNGYFTLDSDCKIIVSDYIKNCNSKIIENILLKSDDLIIVPDPSKYKIDADFIQYHKTNIFKG